MNKTIYLMSIGILIVSVFSGCIEEEKETEDKSKNIQTYFEYCPYQTTYVPQPHGLRLRTCVSPININATCEQKIFALLISKINYHNLKHADLEEISCVWEDYCEGRQFNYCGHDESYFRERIEEIIHRCEDTNSTGDKQ